MQVDVVTGIVIERPRAEVAAFARDPDNVPRWYKNIKSVEWKTPRPLARGSRIGFVADFMGRQLVYTYEVVEFQEDDRFVMRTADGPFPMETTYAWESLGPDLTRMSLRNRGEPTGFSGLMAPLMATMMRQANRKDLALLKRLLETSR